jgi:hypothetical protein
LNGDGYKIHLQIDDEAPSSAYSTAAEDRPLGAESRGHRRTKSNQRQSDCPTTTKFGKMTELAIDKRAENSSFRKVLYTGKTRNRSRHLGHATTTVRRRKERCSTSRQRKLANP